MAHFVSNIQISTKNDPKYCYLTPEVPSYRVPQRTIMQMIFKVYVVATINYLVAITGRFLE